MGERKGVRRRREGREDEVQRQRQRSLGEVSVGRSRVGPGPPGLYIVPPPPPAAPSRRRTLLHPLHACTYAHLRTRPTRSADRRPRSLSSTPISLRSFFSHSWRQTRLHRISDSHVRKYRMYRSVGTPVTPGGSSISLGFFGSLVRRVPVSLFPMIRSQAGGQDSVKFSKNRFFVHVPDSSLKS